MIIQIDAQKRPKYNDGPYIGSNDTSARIMWIQEGEKHDTVVSIAEKIFLNDCSKVAGVILPTSMNFIDISLAIFRMVSSVTVPDW